MLTMDECKRTNLCIDCDNKRCIFCGKIIADCPKYTCDRPGDQFEDCETCEFIKEFQEDIRRGTNYGGC